MQKMEATSPVQSLIHKNYVVEDILAKNKFVTVYIVKRRQQKTLFVLKEIAYPVQEYSWQHLQSLTTLDHPALPFVYQVFADDQEDKVYILMDFIEGISLETLSQMQPEQRFSLPEVTDIMFPIVNVVIYLHNQHPPIIHENINPSTIIHSSISNSSVLVGFRPATAYDPDKTITITPREATSYKAPEQYSGVITSHTDIYALGATFYTLLTGITPVNAFSRLKKLANEQPDPLVSLNQLNPSIPISVCSAIHRAMSLSSKGSFTTVEQFWAALKPLADTIIDEQQPESTGHVTTPFIVQSEPNAHVTTPFIAQPQQGLSTFLSKHSMVFLTLIAFIITLLISVAVGLSLWSYTTGH